MNKQTIHLEERLDKVISEAQQIKRSLQMIRLYNWIVDQIDRDFINATMKVKE
jgi:hypothetical protein